MSRRFVVGVGGVNVERFKNCEMSFLFGETKTVINVCPLGEQDHGRHQRAPAPRAEIAKVSNGWSRIGTR